MQLLNPTARTIALVITLLIFFIIQAWQWGTFNRISANLEDFIYRGKIVEQETKNLLEQAEEGNKILSVYQAYEVNLNQSIKNLKIEQIDLLNELEQKMNANEVDFGVIKKIKDNNVSLQQQLVDLWAKNVNPQKTKTDNPIKIRQLLTDSIVLVDNLSADYERKIAQAPSRIPVVKILYVEPFETRTSTYKANNASQAKFFKIKIKKESKTCSAIKVFVSFKGPGDVNVILADNQGNPIKDDKSSDYDITLSEPASEKIYFIPIYQKLNSRGTYKVFINGLNTLLDSKDFTIQLL